jgi:hypothetical protein
MSQLTCQYCNRPAVYRSSSSHHYNGRDYGPIWECARCSAWVGCHPDGSPLGSVANAALRAVRIQVKQVFNSLWTDVESAYDGIPLRRRDVGHVRQVMRTRAYEWLAHQMKLPPAQCHVAMFDETQCRWAMRIIQDLQPTAVSIRQWAKDREPKRPRVRNAS